MNRDKGMNSFSPWGSSRKMESFILNGQGFGKNGSTRSRLSQEGCFKNILPQKKKFLIEKPITLENEDSSEDEFKDNEPEVSSGCLKTQNFYQSETV